MDDGLTGGGYPDLSEFPKPNPQPFPPGANGRPGFQNGLGPGGGGFGGGRRLPQTPKKPSTLPTHLTANHVASGVTFG